MSDPTTTIPAEDRYERKRIQLLDTEMAYVDTGGEGDPVIFVHGNPTRSYLWRNVIPHVEGAARCLAPDLVGMGESGKMPSHSYRYVDQARYLDAWIEALDLGNNITVVGHDWGGVWTLHWASRFYWRVKSIVYLETLIMPYTWWEWPEVFREPIKNLRTGGTGEEMVIERNEFIEMMLPLGILRDLGEEEMAVYREPFAEQGEARRPTLTWPRQLPIGGEPSDVVQIVKNSGEWATQSDVPKLFINGEPGGVITGPARDYARTWRNQEEVTVNGAHFLQEDSPDEIGEAIASFVKRLDEKF